LRHHDAAANRRLRQLSVGVLALFLVLTLMQLGHTVSGAGEASLILPGRTGNFEVSPALGQDLGAASPGRCAALSSQLQEMLQQLWSAYHEVQDIARKYQNRSFDTPLFNFDEAWRERNYQLRDRLYGMDRCTGLKVSLAAAMMTWRDVGRYEDEVVVATSSRGNHYPDLGRPSVENEIGSLVRELQGG
jgi:hypothetical protein